MHASAIRNAVTGCPISIAHRRGGIAWRQHLRVQCASGNGTRPSEDQQKASRPQPGPPTMKLKKVERLGEEAWAGVAAVDRGLPDGNWGRAGALVACDAAAMLIFAAIGRSGHHEGLQPGAVLQTASPFLLGWLASGALLGGYGRAAQQAGVGKSLGVTARVWAAAVPASVLLRSAQRGYLPDRSFVIVGLIATFVLAGGLRAGFAALKPAQGGTAASQQRQSKRGNPFEFLQLLTSLTKRW